MNLVRLGCCVLVAAVSGSAQQAAEKIEFFERRIRPVLTNNCYTCHTDYAMFGGLKAKLRGLNHVYVQYFGKIPDKVELYNPYNNRECLHCHGGARNFEEGATHIRVGTALFGKRRKL